MFTLEFHGIIFFGFTSAIWRRRLDQQKSLCTFSYFCVHSVWRWSAFVPSLSESPPPHPRAVHALFLCNLCGNGGVGGIEGSSSVICFVPAGSLISPLPFSLPFSLLSSGKLPLLNIILLTLLLRLIAILRAHVVSVSWRLLFHWL